MSHQQLLEFTSRGLLPAQIDEGWPESAIEHLERTLELRFARSLDRRVLLKYLSGPSVATPKQLKSSMLVVLSAITSPARKLKRLQRSIASIYGPLLPHTTPPTGRQAAEPVTVEQLRQALEVEPETVFSRALLLGIHDGHIRDRTYGDPEVGLDDIPAEERLVLTTALSLHRAQRAREAKSQRKLPRGVS